jgi:glutathione S-transferase
MLIVHHLAASQSERIVWLCEELGIAYQLAHYDRDPVTLLSSNYRKIYPFGTAPVITDGDLALGESGAIVEYLIAKYGGGKLSVSSETEEYVDYIYWLHFANSTLMPAINLDMIVRWLGVDRDEEILHAWRRAFQGRQLPGFEVTDTRIAERIAALRGAWRERPIKAYRMMEIHLESNSYFAGNQFTAADVMMVFPLTTMRLFDPRDLSAYPNILRYLQQIGRREAYRRAMAKAEPDMLPVLD